MPPGGTGPGRGFFMDWSRGQFQVRISAVDFQIGTGDSVLPSTRGVELPEERDCLTVAALSPPRPMSRPSSGSAALAGWAELKRSIGWASPCHSALTCPTAGRWGKIGTILFVKHGRFLPVWTPKSAVEHTSSCIGFPRFLIIRSCFYKSIYFYHL